MTDLIREPAKITGSFLGFEGHGILTAVLSFDYGDSTGQSSSAYNLETNNGFGAEFIKRMLRAVGVEEWSQIKGRTIVTLKERARGPVVGITNLPFERGETFVFSELAAKYA